MKSPKGQTRELRRACVAAGFKVSFVEPLEKDHFPFSGPFKVMRNKQEVANEDIRLGDEVVVDS